MNRRVHITWLAALVFLCVFVSPALGQNFTSTNYIVKDPALNESAGFGTSGNFQLWGSIPYIAPTPGTSTSFSLNSGTLSFGSGVTMPTLSAVPGQTQVVLNWTAAIGASVTYEAGIASVSGGPYTYDAPQGTLTATKASLASATTYYFIIRVKESVGAALLGYSNELVATTLAASGSGGGGGGTGGGTTPPPDGWVYAGDGVLVPAPVIPREEEGSGTRPTSTLPTSASDKPVVIIPPPGGVATTMPPLMRQFGIVTAPKDGARAGVPNVTVILERRDSLTGQFYPWPSARQAQTQTDENGLFSYLVPQGEYRIVVQESGYFDYTGEPKAVVFTGDLNEEVKLTPIVSSWLNMKRFVILLGLILGALLALYFRP